MKPFFNETVNLLLRKFWVSLVLDFSQTVRTLQVAETQLKLLTERNLITGEPCTCEYVTLLQSFHRGPLSIHWYIAQNVQPSFSMSVLFRHSSNTTEFTRFLK